ncbi:replication initiator protein [Escherichia coli]|nr:replication initiator protein [Escherichia coli]MQH69987.1 replication initiator protein [Escherichia coli]MQI47053.1 replication initiator protein [Escherichia coli]MQJ21486.1 replication initiator protein [Escherichia coli]MQL20080.1 replication initiator protein [Escherichia coli]
MGSCAAPSAKGDDKFITTDYLQQCLFQNPVAVFVESTFGTGSSAPHFNLLV